MAREMARPRPVPSGLVVKNGSNSSAARARLATPAPRSSTLHARRAPPSPSTTSPSTRAAGGRGLDRVAQQVVERARHRRRRRARRCASPSRVDGHAARRRPRRAAPRRARAPARRRRAARARPERAPGDDQQIGHQPIEPRDLRRRVRDRLRAARRGSAVPTAARSRRSLIDASGLRTSCATPATTRPSAASRSFCASSRPAAPRLARLRQLARRAADAVGDVGELAHARRGTGAVRSSPSAASGRVQPPAPRAERDIAQTRGDHQQRRGERQRDDDDLPGAQRRRRQHEIGRPRQSPAAAARASDRAYRRPTAPLRRRRARLLRRRARRQRGASRRHVGARATSSSPRPAAAHADDRRPSRLERRSATASGAASRSTSALTASRARSRRMRRSMIDRTRIEREQRQRRGDDAEQHDAEQSVADDPSC